MLGAAAGALFGVSDIAIKFLADDIGSGVLELISPWTAAAIIASVVAFYASARGLQIGPGVDVIAITSVAANLTAIVGGILVSEIRDGAPRVLVHPRPGGRRPARLGGWSSGLRLLAGRAALASHPRVRVTALGAPSIRGRLSCG